MGKAGPIVVVRREKENLGLIFQPAKGLAVNNPVAVVLKRRPYIAGDLFLDPSPGMAALLRVWREVVLLPVL
jgi:hypothetical protein